MEDVQPGEPAGVATRSRVHRVLVLGYRWRRWILSTALVALIAAVILTGHVWAVVTLIAGSAVLASWFMYATSWVRTTDRARDSYRAGLKGN